MKKITKPMSLPMSTLSNSPYIEIRGKNTLGVENHKGIVQYSNECICIEVKHGKISAVGSRLEIVRMDQRRIEICGNLERVELS